MTKRNSQNTRFRPPDRHTQEPTVPVAGRELQVKDLRVVQLSHEDKDEILSDSGKPTVSTEVFWDRRWKSDSAQPVDQVARGHPCHPHIDKIKLHALKYAKTKESHEWAKELHAVLRQERHKRRQWWRLPTLLVVLFALTLFTVWLRADTRAAWIWVVWVVLFASGLVWAAVLAHHAYQAWGRLQPVEHLSLFQRYTYHERLDCAGLKGGSWWAVGKVDVFDPAAPRPSTAGQDLEAAEPTSIPPTQSAERPTPERETTNEDVIKAVVETSKKQFWFLPGGFILSLALIILPLDTYIDALTDSVRIILAVVLFLATIGFFLWKQDRHD
jgi:hypothetical protein